VNLSKPPLGSSYSDRLFVTMITRLSNGIAQFNDTVHHEYATMSPFNKDNSRILLFTGSSGLYIVDRSGNVIVDPSTLGLSPTVEARWSTPAPNIFFYHEGNQIKIFNLATRQQTLLLTFTQFASINFGGGESDISDDGDHMTVIGDDRWVGVYTFSTNTFGPTLDIAGRGFDYFDMTADNHVIV